MSCPNCQVFKPKCKSSCCGPVPMERVMFNKNFNLVKRPFELMDLEDNMVIPITEDLTCVFLDPELNCSIYNDRPEVCRKFGDETHIHMTCPYQTKSGEARSNRETKKLMDKQFK